MKIEINLSELGLQSIVSIHIEGNKMTVKGFKETPFITAEYEIPIEKDNKYFNLID